MKDSIMKQKTVLISAAICSLTTLNSCVKEVMNETEGELTSRLSIVTRAPSDGETTIATPVQLYVFGSDGRCAAMQTLESEEAFPSIALAEGTYDVYALGGVDAMRYTLPSQADARSNTEIRLQPGKVLDDLMTSSAHVSLADGEEEQLTLSMERRVVLLHGVTISHVPEDVEAITVSISPLHESLLLDGTLSGTSGNHTVMLQCQSDGTTWKSAADTYLFPPSQKPTISVSFQRESGTKSYAYTCKEELPANYKLTIEGTYQAELGVLISGSVTGVSWSGEKTISLTFNEKSDTVTGQENGEESGNNESGNQNNGGSDEAIEEGKIYKGCYVLTKSDTEVVLLSPTQEQSASSSTGSSQTLSLVNTAVNNWNVDGVAATWRLPNLSEITKILENASVINGVVDVDITIDDEGYFYDAGSGAIMSAKLKNGSVTKTQVTKFCILRPVATITLND